MGCQAQHDDRSDSEPKLIPSLLLLRAARKPCGRARVCRYCPGWLFVTMSDVSAVSFAPGNKQRFMLEVVCRAGRCTISWSSGGRWCSGASSTTSPPQRRRKKESRDGDGESCFHPSLNFSSPKLFLAPPWRAEAQRPLLAFLVGVDWSSLGDAARWPPFHAKEATQGACACAALGKRRHHARRDTQKRNCGEHAARCPCAFTVLLQATDYKQAGSEKHNCL